MSRTALRLGTGAAVTAALLVAGGVGPAGAAGSDFGEHVRHCATTEGFSGTHNPGVMHQGYSGWEPGEHDCGSMPV